MNPSNPHLAVALSKHTGWYGAHSGFYEQVAQQWRQTAPRTKVILPRRGIGSNLLGKLHSMKLGVPVRNQLESAAEVRFLWRLWRSRSAAGVVLNMDDHWSMLRWWPKAPRRLVGVIHIPTSVWGAGTKRACARLSSAIVLWRREIPALEAFVGVGRVRFVPHGVDTAFFHPGDAPREENHLLMCGQFLRDFRQLERVFLRLREARPSLRLTIVVSAHAAENPDLAWAATTAGVTLVSGISDVELRDYYQRSTALLMPLQDSGANNAILEALACGLPIITNDVGGIRDYGGGDIFPVCASETEAMVSLASNLLNDPMRLREISAAQRRLALSLDWTAVSDRLAKTVSELQD